MVGMKVRVVDTTLRDGQLSHWATRMRTNMMLPAGEHLDAAGFDAVEIVGSSFFKVCVRELREDPWERLRLVAGRIRRAPLRTIKTRYISAFQPTPYSLQSLWMERLAVNGVRQIRLGDPSNSVEDLQREVQLARRVGLDPILDLTYSVSPKHTDEYYAERALVLARCDAMHLCLKDPGGLLTPDRTRTLIRMLRDYSGARPVELHTHCNTGLGPLCCLEALRAGATIVDTAIPPLANGASNPSVFNFIDNAAVLGYEVELDREHLHAVERHFRRIAERDGLPVGVPIEYNEHQFRHQVPGGMVSNFRSQLRNLGMEQRLPEVLEEMVRVRAELGYPIMVTPYSQFVGTQAFINVVSGERYGQVTDDLIRYAVGHWGKEEAEGIAPDIKDRILGRSRAMELASQTPGDMTPEELRRQMGVGRSVNDDELLLLYLTSGVDVERLRQAGPVGEDRGDEPLSSLLRGVSTSRFKSIYIEKGDLRVQIVRDEPSARVQHAS